MAPIGGLLALLITGTNFSVSSGVGFLALFGVSVQTGVIMLEYINQLRARGHSIVEAAIEGAVLRLRPVMMTMLVATFGLVPAALSHAIGSDSQRPFAIVIVGGLVAALLIGVVVLPTLYVWVARDDDKLPAAGGRRYEDPSAQDDSRRPMQGRGMAWRSDRVLPARSLCAADGVERPFGSPSTTRSRLALRTTKPDGRPNDHRAEPAPGDHRRPAPESRVFGEPGRTLPLFSPQDGLKNYLKDTSGLDLGLSYTIERGGKRGDRVQAAKDTTAVTRSQVADNERTLALQVATQFINVQLAESTLDLVKENLKSFQNAVEIGDAKFKAGGISENDYLKIKLQLLQFQTDVEQAQLDRAQALSDLRQLLGYDTVPADYDVAGAFDYQPLNLKARRPACSWPRRTGRISGRRSSRSPPRRASTPSPRPTGPRTSPCRPTTCVRRLTGNNTAAVGLSIPLGDLRPQPGRDRAHARRGDPGGASVRRGIEPGEDRRQRRLRGPAAERSHRAVLPFRLPRRVPEEPRHQRLRLQARRHEPVRFPRR